MKATDNVCQYIIRMHRLHIPDALNELEVKYEAVGIMSDIHIQKHVHPFVSYAI